MRGERRRGARGLAALDTALTVADRCRFCASFRPTRGVSVSGGGNESERAVVVGGLVKRWGMTVRVLSVWCALLLALPGCAATKKAGELSDDPAVSEARVGEMNARLQQLATLEQVAAEFEILTRQIAEAVKHVFPGVTWEEGQSVGKMSCPGKLAESDGFVMSTTMLVSSIPIPDDSGRQVSRSSGISPVKSGSRKIQFIRTCQRIETSVSVVPMVLSSL